MERFSKGNKQTETQANNPKTGNAKVQFKDHRPEAAAQLKMRESANPVVQKRKNKTGLPDQLKSGIENLSGHSMDDVKVHYNSSKPAQLNAHAYAQGNQIHLASGQEKHLPHEAWHVVQQKQGRVQPTKQLKGKTNINDDAGLEREADVMGARALQMVSDTKVKTQVHNSSNAVQLTGKGAAVGVGVGATLGGLIGGAIGSIGALAGPIGAVTTMAGAKVGALAGGAIGALVGGIAGHKLTEPSDFAAHQSDKNVDPDAVGGAHGIREIPAENARPDDVPLVPAYRIAMHKLHNVVMVLENADRSGERVQSPRTDKLRAKMVDIQSRGKGFAKAYKNAMRNLNANTNVAALRLTYTTSMATLTTEITNHTREGEGVINKHGYLNGSTLKDKGTGLWRTRWLKTKRAVDVALTSLWNTWKSTLKTLAKTNNGDDSTDAVWNNKVSGEKWKLFYGGSLMKGYKGPPKQNTRFLASHFDVDANMDAPAVAEYLINKKHNKVDRGQLDPKNAPETGVGNMDRAMDKEVKKELLKARLAPNAEGINLIVSEPFETRINAPAGLGAAAATEVTRSTEEQRVRDKLTAVRATHPHKMTIIRDALPPALVSGGALITQTPTGDPRTLTTAEIAQVDHAIDNA